MPPNYTAPSSRSTGRRRRVTLAGFVAASVVGSALLYAEPASAAVPTFPDNILIFPNRDFISIDGYQSHVGDTATVQVVRDGLGVVGSATGKIAAGSPALEINHPGGSCWGAGTGLNVTPDIQPGDKVTISFNGQVVGDTTTEDGTVQATPAGPAFELNGSTLIVRGHLGPNVNRAQIEQRIINPALTTSDVGRRDVAAVDPVLTPAPKGGYSSMLETSGDTFTATYQFLSADTARLAAEGEMRLMSWEVQDLDANRQGLTIAEYGQLGGPGMGGCPNGPLQTGPPAPSNVTAVRSSDGTSIKMTWTPATAVPGTPAITGYRITAVADTILAGSEQVEIGKRIGNAAATGTTITGLAPAETYAVELRSVSAAGDTNPAATVHPLNPGQDTTAPTVAAAPGGGTYALPQTVTLTANEPGSEIYYSLTGTDLLTGDSLSTDPSVTRYTAPFAVAQTGKITYVAFDPSGNVSAQGAQTYTITNKPVPAAPVFTGTPTAGAGSVTLTWSAPDPGAPDLAITEYAVQVYNGDGTAFGSPRTTAGNVTTLVVTGLTADTPYLFTVRASNVNGPGPESAKAGPVAPQGALFANAGPDQPAIVRGTKVTLNGAGSTAGVTYSWAQVLTGPTDPDKVTLAGATSASPTFTFPLYRYPMTNNGLTFRLTVRDSSGATKTDDVKITPQSDRVTIATGKFKAASDLRLDGSGTVIGAVVTVHTDSLAGPVLGQAQVIAAPPAAGGTWTLRLRNGQVPATNRPVWIESTLGGTAGPFTPAA